MELTELNEADVYYGRSLQCIELELAIEAGTITTLQGVLALLAERRGQLDLARGQELARNAARAERLAHPTPSRPARTVHRRQESVPSFLARRVQAPSNGRSRASSRR